MIAGVGIPTPPIYIDLDYHKRLDYGRFIQPSFYIKAHQTAGTGLVNHLDRYDLLKEDIEWLQTYNAAAEAKRPPGPTMTEDDMERLIDLFEHQAGKITLSGMRAEMMSLEDKIDPRQDFPLVRAIVVAATQLHVRTKILEPVYEYWIDKRKRLGKALLRQYQEPPPRGNTDPHVAFRVRTEGRRISKRNPRKDDHSGYHKMMYLKKDFQKVIDVVDNVQTREQLKREQALLAIHIFDARLQATPYGQRMLKDHPAAAQAIAQLNAIPPPPSSMAGAPSPALPPALLSASQDDIRAFRLLHSSQPPCSYSRAELEAEGRRRRAQNQHLRAAASAAAAAAASAGGGHAGHHSSSHHGQKRPNQSGHASSSSHQRRGGAGGGAAQGGAGGQHGHGHGGHRDEQSRREKEQRKAARRELGYTLVPLEDEPEDNLDLTDEEDLLSENEEERAFYANLEQHLKRVKIERPSFGGMTAMNGLSLESESKTSGGGGETSVVKVEPHGAIATYRSYPPGLAQMQQQQMQHHPRPISVGYLLGGATGRGGRIWIDCEYRQVPAHSVHPSQQHASHHHGQHHPSHQQHGSHHPSSTASSHHHLQQQQQQSHPSSSQSNMQIHVHPPSSSHQQPQPQQQHHATSGAVPMDIDHGHRPAQVQSQAIKV
jgi:hypothetical protein